MSFSTSTTAALCQGEFIWRGKNVMTWAATLTRFCVPKYLTCVNIIRNRKKFAFLYTMEKKCCFVFKYKFSRKSADF